MQTAGKIITTNVARYKPSVSCRTYASSAWMAIAVIALTTPGCGDNFDPELPFRENRYNDQWSAARNWNEALLGAIRFDLARPTVHARNLFHSSAMMYDAWAAYDASAEPYFLGNTVGDYTCAFSAQQREQLRSQAQDVNAERSTAIAYAMHRLLTHRFQQSPGREFQVQSFANLLADMGHQRDGELLSLEAADPQERAGALGVLLADCVIAYGLQDNANEANNYGNQLYQPVNPALEPDLPGNPNIVDPDRWQPLFLRESIDQAGNVVENKPAFVGAEWGNVTPFALRPEVCTDEERDGISWRVCHDPGPPAWLRGNGAQPEEYLWNHSVVAYWSSHLDPADNVVWDISPGSLGNTQALPQDVPSLRDFYDPFLGGVDDQGHALNPSTGQPYEDNEVLRGDYTRVLAEFWADGPNSETPPGHWFTIVNKAVSDHPSAVKRYRGQGEVLDDLEWDVKLYFVLGAGVHDAAITCWGIKGWYDYTRPVSAIRFMASKGQSTDSQMANYDPEGIPLVDGYVEIIAADDPLAGANGENVGKIKVYAWRGPRFIDDAAIDESGVGWILAEEWWPYQRPSFVSPPFAGYMSGHSTFSRTAAEIVTDFTGDEFFPGGMASFLAQKDDFLVFEEGPSTDIELQWATYRDASDQTSLSRIWGGIHPPVDDVPGRRIGIIIAADTVAKADSYFSGAAAQ